MNPASDVKIRFNTKWEEASSPHLKWRVLVDGSEKLASHVSVLVPCETTQDVIDGGITKWHFSCRGQVRWDKDRVTIR